MEASGKLIIIGVYNNDIVIPTDEFTATQMQFLFSAECLRSDPFQFVKFEVTLPGNDPLIAAPEHIVQVPDTYMPERKRLYIKQAIAVTAVKLRPGRILARVIHEKGEIPVRGGWIVKLEAPSAGTVTPPSHAAT
jgi:hypothetical protein